MRINRLHRIRAESVDNEVVPPEYKIIRRDRGSRGVGVAIITKNELMFVVLAGIADHETLWCQVKCASASTLSAVAYSLPLLPSCASPAFLPDVQQHLRKRR